MRDIKYIVVHCSATPENKDVDVEDVRGWHLNIGWCDIGYHYFIKLDGTLQEGRPLEIPGAHVKGYNKHSIGICYAGGVDDRMNAKDTRTELQKITLVNLLKVLRKDHPDAVILGHRDFRGVAKACPSFNAKKEYEWI